MAQIVSLEGVSVTNLAGDEIPVKLPLTAAIVDFMQEKVGREQGLPVHGSLDFPSPLVLLKRPVI